MKYEIRIYLTEDSKPVCFMADSYEFRLGSGYMFNYGEVTYFYPWHRIQSIEVREASNYVS